MNKRDQIYEAALRLFNEYGFDKTPTSLIAKEAGVAIGTLFHYFPTKEELINSLYLRCKDSMITRALDGLESQKTYRGQLMAVNRNILRWGVKCSEEYLFFQQFSNSANIFDSTKKQGREKFNTLYDLIVRGIDTEIIKNIDVELLISSVMGLIGSMVVYLMSRPELLEDESFMEQAFGLVWDAIKK